VKIATTATTIFFPSTPECTKDVLTLFVQLCVAMGNVSLAIQRGAIFI